MANFLPSLDWTSDGIDYLRHWGVFVTDNTLLDIEVILQRIRAWENDGIDLGTLYELRRDSPINNVKYHTAIYPCCYKTTVAGLFHAIHWQNQNVTRRD